MAMEEPEPEPAGTHDPDLDFGSAGESGGEDADGVRPEVIVEGEIGGVALPSMTCENGSTDGDPVSPDPIEEPLPGAELEPEPEAQALEQRTEVIPEQGVKLDGEINNDGLDIAGR